MGKFLNAYSNLDLDPTKLNIKLVRAIFIYSNVHVFQFRVPRSIFLFELSYKNTHTHKHGNTHTHRDSNEYPIVAFSKNATIKKCQYARKNINLSHYMDHKHCNTLP